MGKRNGPLRKYGLGCKIVIMAKPLKYESLQDGFTLFATVADWARGKGYNINKAMQMGAVVCHETGNGKSCIAKKCNNFSGIKYFNYSRMYKCDCPGGYGGFPTFGAWFDVFIKTLSKGPGYPLKGKTLLDFVNGMKANRYFEDTVNNYYNGCRNAYNLFAPRYVEYVTGKKLPPVPVNTSEADQTLQRIRVPAKQRNQAADDGRPDVSFLDNFPDIPGIDDAKKGLFWIGVGLAALIVLRR